MIAEQKQEWGKALMEKKQFDEIAAYMDECMSDAAHDKEHVWRVLGYALRLAEQEKSVDYDLLITACLLHDIGRAAQFQDPSLDHAAVGADMAAQWLLEHGHDESFCERVRKAIRSHRYRTGGRAESIEAQILFDSDKLDVCGMMGLFRTIAYCDHVGEAFYTVGADGKVEFTAEAPASVVQEYCYKLSKLGDRFYTQGAKRLEREMGAKLKAAVTDTVNEANAARAGLSRLDGILR